MALVQFSLSLTGVFITMNRDILLVKDRFGALLSIMFVLPLSTGLAFVLRVRAKNSKLKFYSQQSRGDRGQL